MVNVFQPRSTELQKYVDCFYVFDRFDQSNTNYMVYPQTNTPLAFFKNAEVKAVGNHLQIRPSDEQPHCVDVVGRYLKPLLVSYYGEVEEVAVHFKPLGINHFIQQPFAKIASENSQKIKEKAWTDFTPKLFQETSLENRLSKLEEFLLQQYRDIEICYLYEAVEKLMDPMEEVKVATIAEKMGVSSRTLQRQFNNYVGCTPAIFKRIARFRHSIDITPLHKELKDLMTIGYESGFYDQSYFGKEYRALTGESPKSFFKEVSLISENKFAWKIV